jgi:NAD(P)-dependent dehydrogenase (short-subunit alcohol dehydrogenase family)
MGIFVNKHVLITGASDGLGAALALAFAKEGANLLLLARDVDKLEKVDDQINALGAKATLIPFDLSNWMNLRQLTQYIYDAFGQLDVVIGNAAQIGTLTTTPHAVVDEWEQIYKVNALANFALIQATDPLLRLSQAGRAIYVTCSPYNLTYPYAQAYWGHYLSSKAALESIVLTYAEEVASTSLRVNLIDPGPLRTKLRHQALPGEPSQNARDPKEVTQLFLDLSTDSNNQHGQIIRAQPLGEIRSNYDWSRKDQFSQKQF